jgi:predicted phage terminase large subunit-like protein
MQQPWYQRLFPRTRLSTVRQAVHSFETTAGGGRIATSVGGVLTGMGADVIIIDDPVKPDDALSQVERQKANDWFRHTLVTRLNDKLAGAIIVVMQRLHEDDFVGHILGLDDWEVLSFPAIAEEDEVHEVRTPFGTYTHHRRAGEALHPEREPLSVLEALRRSLGSAHFAAQYLQRPTPPGGGTVKIEWFRRYDKAPKRFDRIIQSWDTASKVKELNDYSVCTTWGVRDKRYYLLGVLRDRLEYPQLKAAVLTRASLYPNPYILIEDKGSGTSLIQDLKRDGVQVTACVPQGDKLFRMEGQTAFIEAGGVYLPRKAHWLEAFLHEVSMFPKGRFDDQVDSMSQALHWGRNDTCAGWFEYMREQSLRARGLWKPAPTIRFHHDNPSMAIHTLAGRTLRPEPDGTFLVTPDEWRYLANVPGIVLIDDGCDEDDD